MIARHRRVPLLVLLFASAAVVAVAVAGCGKQSEGQRCVAAANGNNDCNSPLVCVPAAQLQDKSTDRCCPAAGLPIHVSSCTRAGGIGTGGTDGGTGGTGATGGTDSGSDAAGGTAGGGGSSGAGGTSGSGGTSGASAGGATDASAG